MGRTKKAAVTTAELDSAGLLSTLEDFTSKDNWDKFFTLRNADNSFEWYSEWPELEARLLTVLQSVGSSVTPASLRILVPGCGNSRLSEHLYDAGFKDITNVDFSKVVIADMLRRNVRDRPGMRWRVMDMTAMQLPDESFDVILDKGGLDALMEPKLGPKLGKQYLSEVKRILITGGKFVCLSLVESHVLGLLLSMFRFGWKTSMYPIIQKSSGNSGLSTFMIVFEKDASRSVHLIDETIKYRGDQASGLIKLLKAENQIRLEYSRESDIQYALEDLQLGVKGEITKLVPGQRILLTLGEVGESCFSYEAVMLDAREPSTSFLYHFGVFLIPKNRNREWLFSSIEGQWQVVESSNASRLLMVFLDSSHSIASMEEIQKDLSPLVKKLNPSIATDAKIPFMMASDGIKQQHTVHQAVSLLTGPIVVEDVKYERYDNKIFQTLQSDELAFRRLVFQRAENLVQSEALLIKDASLFEIPLLSKSVHNSKSKANRKQKTEPFCGMKICHDYLASSYHIGIISGFFLVAPYLQTISSSGHFVNVVVIGLGAGVLPMFLSKCMAFLNVEVVELDKEVAALAKDYFDFKDHEYLKVHIEDGIHFVENIKSYKVDILIVDVDSSDSSSEMTCPAANFVEESFLFTVKEALADEGLFIINLVTRSPAVKNMVIKRMKMIFGRLFGLQLEEDLNMVLFAIKSDSDANIMDFSDQLSKLLKLNVKEMEENIIDFANKIKPLDESGNYGEGRS